MINDLEWYVVFVEGGKENEIAAEAAKHNKINQSIAPIKNLPYKIDGEWIERESIVFPNYVFIQCRMDAEVFHYVNSINHVRRWLGVDHMWPTTVPPNEMDRVIKIYADDEPSQFLSNIKVDRHKRRIYGSIELYGKEQRITLPYKGNKEKKLEQ